MVLETVSMHPNRKTVLRPLLAVMAVLTICLPGASVMAVSGVHFEFGPASTGHQGTHALLLSSKRFDELAQQLNRGLR